MKIAVAGDHAGFELKEFLAKDLTATGHEVLDLGAHRVDPLDDYPDFAQRLGESLLDERAERGVAICGSGVGISVALNKFPGLRAAVCHDTYSASQGVEHDNMNVLCLGERIIGPALAQQVVHAFVTARFTAEERHLRRLSKVQVIERRFLRDLPA